MSDDYWISDLTKELNQAKGKDARDCLVRSLRAAIKLEFATVPPYLTAMWSVRDGAPDADPAAMK
ncbi:MAG TPA: ferritin-like domain-containing protein [Urbifossiella sp.]|nr:ferritin-like domain-containing protein [Urbifossiella sp.]